MSLSVSSHLPSISLTEVSSCSNLSHRYRYLSPMHASYMACCEIVRKEIALLGADAPNLQKTKQTQMEHVISTMRNTPYSQEDASKLLDELLKASDVFSFEQRKNIGAALSDIGRGNKASCKMRTSVQQQTLLAPYAYARKKCLEYHRRHVEIGRCETRSMGG